MRKITGVVFSDLGQAASFMALDWVQRALEQALGFLPFPATLNLRPQSQNDARLWQAVQGESSGVPLCAADGRFCNARLYRVQILPPLNAAGGPVQGAILLPEVKGYPKDKIEIVAPVRLKQAFGIQDGDQLTLELVR